MPQPEDAEFVVERGQLAEVQRVRVQAIAEEREEGQVQLMALQQQYQQVNQQRLDMHQEAIDDFDHDDFDLPDIEEIAGEGDDNQTSQSVAVSEHVSQQIGRRAIKAPALGDVSELDGAIHNHQMAEQGDSPIIADVTMDVATEEKAQESLAKRKGYAAKAKDSKIARRLTRIFDAPEEEEKE
jgi:hypothetical protein